MRPLSSLSSFWMRYLEATFALLVAIFNDFGLIHVKVYNQSVCFYIQFMINYDHLCNFRTFQIV